MVLVAMEVALLLVLIVERRRVKKRVRGRRRVAVRPPRIGLSI